MTDATTTAAVSSTSSPASTSQTTSATPCTEALAAVTVQFRWGTQVFYRTETVQCNRFVYKSRGTVDGKGGLILGYSDSDGGQWQLGSGSGGCLYRFRSAAESPAELIGDHPWER